MRGIVAVALVSVLTACGPERMVASRPQPTQPLMIVDGAVVTEAQFNRLDAANIEAIEVVKGAAAQRLYGHMSHYHGGAVVVVTTRKSR